MNNEVIPFGPGALAFIACYLSGLLVIGWLGHRARRENSLRDFYLGGQGIGFLILVMTLYATQYSGNTLFGFSGKAYRIGFTWLICVHFMTAIIVGFLLFAPQLHALARRRHYITPADFLADRFRHRGLNLLASVLLIAALSNFLLAQLTAMGRALQGLTTLPPDRAFFWGVILLAVIMLVYETLGGFRAVVWADTVQGTLLMVGFLILLGFVLSEFGSLADASRVLLHGGDGMRQKVLPPDATGSRNWLSYVLIVGLGGALYPQAIQRIYAARTAASLRRSLALMAFFPLTTALIAVLIGIQGAANFPGLQGAEADRILAVICRQVQQQSLWGYWFVVLVFSAILAALMSTADSCLLTISSMAVRDIYHRELRPRAGEAELTRTGKILSWVLVALMAAVAIHLESRPGTPTLMRLLDLKFDLLVQLAPAFILGIHWRPLEGRAVFWGVVAGLITSFSLYAASEGPVFGFHHGLVGLVPNLTVAVAGSLALSHRRRSLPESPQP